MHNNYNTVKYLKVFNRHSNSKRFALTLHAVPSPNAEPNPHLIRRNKHPTMIPSHILPHS